MFQRIKETIEKGKSFLVATHVDPDGDALGSAFALAFALESAEKQAIVYVRGEVPYRYRFLPKPSNIIHELDGASGFDAVFVVDCGELSRVGKGSELLEKNFIVNIDHHNENGAFGQINILDERASSTAEILYLVLKGIGTKFSREMAINIYTAILTDTGSFRYDSTTKRAFSICEEMTDYGVVPSQVAAAIYESHPKERFQLFCQVLGTLEMFCDNKVVTAYVTEEMFAKTGTNREYTEGFVEDLKEMRDIEVVCFFRQVGPEKYKVSMRSKGDVDVALVGRKFGGGGHKKAAGCTLEGSIDDVKKRLTGVLGL